jgi:nascent polypeptide-associated complex subunit alpha
MKMNPRKLEKMARQMGMNMEQIEAEEVIIKKKDGSRIVVCNPNVSRINMMGQETFQVTGEVAETPGEGFSDEDVELVADQTGASPEDARSALKETGDLTKAIMRLKKH